MASISTANLSHKWADNGYWNAEASDKTVYAGFATANNINYVYRLTIKVPAKASSVTVNVPFTYSGAIATRKMRYAFSLTEKDSTYANANASTAADGTVNVTASSGTLTMKYTGTVNAGANLYLYLWTGEATSVFTLVKIKPVANHTASYEPYVEDVEEDVEDVTYNPSSANISGTTIGSAVSVVIKAEATTLTHDVTVTYGSYSKKIASKVTARTVSWTPALADFGALIPNATSIKGTIKVTTYNGSTTIGSKSYSHTLNLPASVVPTIDASKITAAAMSDNATVSGWGVFVQGYSYAKVTVPTSARAGAYGSTISSVSLQYDGKTYSSMTTPVFTTSGAKTLTVVVKDSRGRTASANLTVQVNAYSNPYFKTFRAARAYSTGMAADDGKYIKAYAAAAFASCGGKNSITIKATGASADGSVTFTAKTLTNKTETTYLPVSTGLTPDKTYTVNFTVTDDLGKTGTAIVVLKSTSTHDFVIAPNHQNRAAFFKLPERDGVEVPGNIWGETIYAGTYSLSDPIQIGPTMEDSSFAPADRGIGNVKWLSNSTEIDTVQSTGVYSYSDGNTSANIPSPLGELIAINRTENIGTQFAIDDNYPHLRLKVRKRAGGTWRAWEWMNPPMVAGVEYLTTERSDGDPVYVKRVSYTNDAEIGNASGVAMVSIPHGISGYGKLVRVFGSNYTANYPLPYIGSTGGITAVTAVNSTSVNMRIKEMTWSSGYVWYFDIYYTK